jgi:hypothetical protein
MRVSNPFRFGYVQNLLVMEYHAGLGHCPAMAWDVIGQICLVKGEHHKQMVICFWFHVTH